MIYNLISIKNKSKKFTEMIVKIEKAKIGILLFVILVAISVNSEKKLPKEIANLKDSIIKIEKINDKIIVVSKNGRILTLNKEPRIVDELHLNLTIASVCFPKRDLMVFLSGKEVLSYKNASLERHMKIPIEILYRNAFDCKGEAIVIGLRNGSILYIEDLNRNKSFELKTRNNGSYIICTRFHNDGMVAVSDKGVEIYEPEGKLKKSKRFESTYVRSCFIANEKIGIGLGNFSLEVLDLSLKEKIRRNLNAEIGVVRIKDNFLLAGLRNGKFYVFDLEKNAMVLEKNVGSSVVNMDAWRNRVFIGTLDQRLLVYTIHGIKEMEFQLEGFPTEIFHDKDSLFIGTNIGTVYYLTFRKNRPMEILIFGMCFISVIIALLITIKALIH
ncbi:MAG: hypothetical protein DRO65_03510 [Candidatus Altiarchaeales archaeon]|nr:MAG: hypothetical protein DRO65_03510 [Candidatus Altiarchaeales archaeon]